MEMDYWFTFCSFHASYKHLLIGPRGTNTEQILHKTARELYKHKRSLSQRYTFTVQLRAYLYNIAIFLIEYSAIWLNHLIYIYISSEINYVPK